MFDNEGHWIDDPLDVVNAKPDFSGLGMKPIHKKKKELKLKAMLFDEDGQAYVEPPLLPEDTNVFWIVADYRRMYDTQKKMRSKMKKLAEKNSQMAHYNFFMRGRFIELVALTKRLAKELESRGYKLSSEDRTAIFDADCIATPKKKAGKPYV